MWRTEYIHRLICRGSLKAVRSENIRKWMSDHGDQMGTIMKEETKQNISTTSTHPNNPIRILRSQNHKCSQKTRSCCCTRRVRHIRRSLLRTRRCLEESSVMYQFNGMTSKDITAILDLESNVIMLCMYILDDLSSIAYLTNRVAYQLKTAN